MTCGQITNVHLKWLTINRNDQCMEKRPEKSAYRFNKHVITQMSSRNVYSTTNDQYIRPLEFYVMIIPN